MNSSEYLDTISKRYERYFNVHRNYNLLETDLDIFAEYNVHSEKYFLSKSAVIYSFNNFEYCLCKCFDQIIIIEQLDLFTDFLIKTIDKIVKPSTEHMSTCLTGIMVSERGFSQEVIQKARRFKYSRNFLFTLKGWCDVRLILVDLEKSEVITNKKGREVKKNYCLITQG